eukprot:CAMPEP_0117686378 /NCGR_PEP_ID=MMETSP0804-20121206/22406_1 /TAXON_ID=1074897 /ORGANISM="Tetraselmis astigmatica, Strain CCMP880" /LENGTH=49 /DNA_ID=CAMNT_0005498043 /DNA_START=597 /DNA_END=746 /DNA_ORIENTATION=+
MCPEIKPEILLGNGGGKTAIHSFKSAAQLSDAPQDILWRVTGDKLQTER